MGQFRACPLLSDALRIERSRIAIHPAVRGAIGFAVPLVIGVATGQTPAGVAVGLGVFNVTLSELLVLDGQIGQGRDALALIARGVAVGDPLAVIKPAISPTGSTFYLGDQLPGSKNDWFYCDAGQKQLRRVRLAAESFDRIVSEEVVKLGCSDDVATGPDGALYYSDAQGTYRIRMPGADVLPSPKS